MADSGQFRRGSSPHFRRSLFRPAHRVLIGEGLPNGAATVEAPNMKSSATATAAVEEPTTCFEEPQCLTLHRTSRWSGAAVTAENTELKAANAAPTKPQCLTSCGGLRRPLVAATTAEAALTTRTIMEAPIAFMAHGNSLTAPTAAEAALTTTNESPKSLAAATATDAALTTSFEAPTIMAHGNSLTAATAAEAALTTCFKAPQLLTSHGASPRPLAAARTLAASSESRRTALLSKPTPWTATSIDGEGGVDGSTSPPPFLAGPTVNVHHSTADDNLLRLNGAPHHSPVGSSPPTSAQPADPSLPWKRVEIFQQQAAPAPLAAPLFRTHSPTAGVPANSLPEFSPAAAAAAPKIIPTTDEHCHMLIRVFKTGRFVRPSIDVVRAGSRRWDCTAVGYFLGRKPYYHHLNDYVRSVWPEVKEVTATSNGFYFFKFKTEVAMEEVIEGGPWLFQGQPIVLQRWEPGMVLRKHKHTQVPVWIRLRHLPVEFWTNEGLSTVASGVGRPLYQDTITRACTRLDFARVCVMLDISSTLPKHLVVMMPKEDGSEIPCKVEVEYEWVPPKCKQCMSLGHSMATCPDSKKSDKPTVAVYIQKRPVQPPPKVSQPNGEMAAVRTVQPAGDEEDEIVEKEDGAEQSKINDKGKAPLAQCYVMNAAVWNVRGLNRRDHQVSVKELVSEFRLNFLGILETRVSAIKVLRVQTFLPRWSWFTAYDVPGNRIWIAWDDELLDLEVLNLDVQFIHCRITIRGAHLSVLVTVVYGANDSISRRELWQGLETLADSISDEPWIVGEILTQC
ncbi:hypothetical protein Sango_3084400 [Sesamum angolense]|uniref:DUF4283 domain-containing protein n=1 Tax=Sesamum angolense TaxID=2727404 RepID=A0AAE1W0F6_9LAMI|nr:hypothetical protein Sango_3084400 [Sesamum angolense]